MSIWSQQVLQFLFLCYCFFYTEFLSRFFLGIISAVGSFLSKLLVVINLMLFASSVVIRQLSNKVLLLVLLLLVLLLVAEVIKKKKKASVLCGCCLSIRRQAEPINLCFFLYSAQICFFFRQKASKTSHFRIGTQNLDVFRVYLDVVVV